MSKFSDPMASKEEMVEFMRQFKAGDPKDLAEARRLAAPSPAKRPRGRPRKNPVETIQVGPPQPKVTYAAPDKSAAQSTPSMFSTAITDHDLKVAAAKNSRDNQATLNLQRAIIGQEIDDNSVATNIVSESAPVTSKLSELEATMEAIKNLLANQQQGAKIDPAAVMKAINTLEVKKPKQEARVDNVAEVLSAHDQKAIDDEEAAMAKKFADREEEELAKKKAEEEGADETLPEAQVPDAKEARQLKKRLGVVGSSHARDTTVPDNAIVQKAGVKGGPSSLYTLKRESGSNDSVDFKIKGEHSLVFQAKGKSPYAKYLGAEGKTIPFNAGTLEMIESLGFPKLWKHLKLKTKSQVAFADLLLNLAWIVEMPPVQKMVAEHYEQPASKDPREALMEMPTTIARETKSAPPTPARVIPGGTPKKKTKGRGIDDVEAIPVRKLIAPPQKTHRVDDEAFHQDILRICPIPKQKKDGTTPRPKAVFTQRLHPDTKKLVMEKFDKKYPYAEEAIKQFKEIHSYVPMQVSRNTGKHKILNGAGLTVVPNDPNDWVHRLTVNMGIMRSGNTNVALKNETTQLIDLLAHNGDMSNEQAYDLHSSVAKL